jgi:hypothetical protein
LLGIFLIALLLRFQKIKLLNYNQTFLVGLPVVIAGWGMTNKSTRLVSSRLKVLKLDVVDSNICKKKFPSFQNYQICTGMLDRVLNHAACEVIMLFYIFKYYE